MRRLALELRTPDLVRASFAQGLEFVAQWSGFVFSVPSCKTSRGVVQIDAG